MAHDFGGEPAQVVGWSRGPEERNKVGGLAEVELAGDVEEEGVVGRARVEKVQEDDGGWVPFEWRLGKGVYDLVGEWLHGVGIRACVEKRASKSRVRLPLLPPTTCTTAPLLLQLDLNLRICASGSLHRRAAPLSGRRALLVSRYLSLDRCTDSPYQYSVRLARVQLLVHPVSSLVPSAVAHSSRSSSHSVPN